MDIWHTLMNEHHLLQQFLDRLETAKIQMELGECPPKEFFAHALEFARSFADKYHHFKEEYLLFGFLAMKKKGELDAQIEALRYSHERGKSLLNEIANTLNAYRKKPETYIISILENLAAYISLLKQHIREEDHVFFLIAAKAISPEEQAELQKVFQEEDIKRGKGFLERIQELLSEMDLLLT